MDRDAGDACAYAITRGCIATKPTAARSSGANATRAQQIPQSASTGTLLRALTRIDGRVSLDGQARSTS